MIFLRLYFEFFKTGLFAVGGGLATLPFLSKIAAETGWFTQAQLLDMVAVSESTPGPIGVNMATYVGFVTAGIPGAAVATLGLITPPILIILMISSFLNAFRHNRFVEGAFRCLRPTSTGLIAAAGLGVALLTFFQENVTLATAASSIQWKAVILAIILLVVTRFVKQTKGLHPIIWIAFSAVVGVVFSFAGV